MKVVVTGCAGFIGSAVSLELLKKGHHVVGVDSLTNDVYPAAFKMKRLKAIPDSPNFVFEQLSIGENNLDSLMDGADVVLNEAASPGLVLSWTHYDNYVRNNVSAAFALAASMQRTGVRRLVQASTSSVYGTIADGNEESITKPISPYGVTKLAAEHALTAWSEESDLQLTILRYFSVYGPSQRPDMAYEIFCERLLRGEPLQIFGDGHQSRSNTFIDDIVNATVAAIEIPEGLGAINVCGGEPIELLEALQILANELEVEPKLEFREARRGDQRATQGNYARARQVLGWEPQVVPSDGLRRQAKCAQRRFLGMPDQASPTWGS